MPTAEEVLTEREAAEDKASDERERAFQAQQISELKEARRRLPASIESAVSRLEAVNFAGGTLRQRWVHGHAHETIAVWFLPTHRNPGRYFFSPTRHEVVCATTESAHWFSGLPDPMSAEELNDICDALDELAVAS